MERLIRLTAVLSDAGERGVPAATLMKVAGFEANDTTDALGREFRHLRRQGWQIDNLSAAREDAVWRLRKGDSRLRLRLSSAEQAALQRAALLADRSDLAVRLGLEPTVVRPVTDLVVEQADGLEHLDAVMRAVQRSAVIRFRYNGRSRAVHPASVRHQNNQWYLSGREDDDAAVKHFVVSRMSEVRLGQAGTATRVEPVRRLALHPLRWEMDEPTEVTLVAAEEFLPDVVRWLQQPLDTQRADGGTCIVTYRVTHRAAMRARLYMLGERVRVLGPAEFREELLADLRDMAGV
ncbi:WYL domain-containing protein [Nocardioides dubius]|uniref:WYL domain-containing protein n=2 Tax=Nocardioides dubius TaxID=317019 RepID=A0ABN1TLX3_9ACTN